MNKKVVTKIALLLFLFFATGIAVWGDEINYSGAVEGVASKAAEAAEAAQPVAQPTGRELSLDQAIQLAMENNTTLKLADIDKRKAYVAADQARIQNDAMGNSIQSSGAQLSKYTGEKVKANAKLIADKAYEVAREQVKYQVASLYYSALEAKDLVMVNQSALERANKQLENAEASFAVGTVAKTDVLTAQTGQAQAQANLTAANNQLDLALINLNKTIGLDLSEKANLTGSITDTPGEAIDLQKVIEASMGTRLDMTKANVSLENAQEVVKALQAYSPGTFEARTAGIDVQAAQINVENTSKQVVSDLTQATLNIKAAQETLEYLKVGVDQSSEAERLANLRYGVGMATSLEVLTASSQLADIEAKKIKAMHSYSLARLAFETAKVAPLQ